MTGQERARVDPATRNVGGSTRPRLPALFALLALALLLALDRSQLASEWRFFHDRALVSASGAAPVPQDDAATPALDAALRRAAALLPRRAVCVVAVDAWERTYFRASYLLMPRDVWPTAALPSTVSAAQLGRALALHHADCALIPRGGAVPSGLRRMYGGAIDLYLVARGRRTP